MKTAILLDGHFARIHLKSLIQKNATRRRLQAMATASLIEGEELAGIYYYDCSPFSGTLELPISHTKDDFSKHASHNIATALHAKIKSDENFHFRRGQLSFDGWALRKESIEALKTTPRALVDADFEPLIRQKQVDMLIGIDMAKLALGGEIERMVLITSDSDFVPAINYAQTKGVKIFLITSDTAKATLKNSCQRRFVQKDKLDELLED